jgi:transcriptional regulator with XRE-family HTH domain
VSVRRKRRRERKLRQRRTEPKRTGAASSELQEADHADRLAYSRKQAAEALGVSVSTIDRRVIRSVHTVKTPWGQRLIPVAELERFLRDHLEAPGELRERGSAGRPPSLPRRAVERIRLEYARGRGLADIARALNEDGVPTAHGGRQWWPSTVRAVLVRSTPLPSAEPNDRAA